MAKFTLYSPDLAETVLRFNERMSGQKAIFSFTTGADDFDASAGSGLARERFVAMDKEGEMRAGYYLKHQRYKIGSATQDVANLQAPISEGLRDHAFAAFGPAIVMDALRRSPVTYSLGMGGASLPYPRLLAAMKWNIAPVPFYFKILHPFRFCRSIRFLRAKPVVRLALDFLAFSGLGFLGVRLANLRSQAPRLKAPITVERVDAFAPWADEFWDRTSAAYGFTAVRDAKVLSFLYGDARFLRVRVCSAGRIVGWAVCLATSFEQHLQFGALRLGSLVDCLAEPGAELIVLNAAEQALAQAGVDLIVTNQSHRAWKAALSRAAYLEGPSNFVLACSPGLWRALQDLGLSLEDVHMNRGDGDGPINL